MIFIIGGTGQGKVLFAVKQFGGRIKGKMADGCIVSWEEFKMAECGIHLQAMIRRRLAGGESLDMLEQDMAAELFCTCPDRIIITEEIGCGIVPADAFERKYRELTGRICCQLAASSQEVWRVTAGIGQRIK